MRDIEVGEEFGGQHPPSVLLMPRVERQKTISEWTRISICTCPTCSLPAEQVEVSDANRAFLMQTFDLLAEKKDVTLKHMEKAFAAAKAEQLCEAFVDLKYHAGMHYLTSGKSSKTMKTAEDHVESDLYLILATLWLREAQEGLVAMEGENSHRVKKQEAMLKELEGVVVPSLTGRTERMSKWGKAGQEVNASE